MMADSMTFPKTFDEFAEQYKKVDNKEVYTNGTELIPIFRVKQWLEHKSAEVKHGEWELKSETHRYLEEIDEEFYVECPFCNRVYYVPFEFEDEKMLEYAKKNYPYCNCGAKMDGRKEKQ